MAVSTVQTKAQRFARVPMAMTFASNVTAGNMIFVIVEGTTKFPTDNLSNTYTLIDTIYINVFGDNKVYAYYAKNITGGACTVSVDHTSTFGAFMIAGEYGGLRADPFVTYNIEDPAAGATPSITSTLPSTVADSLVIGCAVTSWTNTHTAGAGFGDLATTNSNTYGVRGGLESKAVTSKGVQTVTFGVSSPFGTPNANGIGVFIFSGIEKGVKCKKPATGGIKIKKPASGGIKIKI